MASNEYLWLNIPAVFSCVLIDVIFMLTHLPRFFCRATNKTKANSILDDNFERFAKCHFYTKKYLVSFILSTFCLNCKTKQKQQQKTPPKLENISRDENIYPVHGYVPEILFVWLWSMKEVALDVISLGTDCKLKTWSVQVNKKGRDVNLPFTPLKEDQLFLIFIKNPPSVMWAMLCSFSAP